MDQNATNGVIHVIDKVLYPVPSLNLVQLVGTTEDFSTLLYCVIRANLEGQLAGEFKDSNGAIYPVDLYSDAL